MATTTSYADFVKWRAERNPCLKPLVEYLGNKSRNHTRAPTIHSIDYTPGPSTKCEIQQLSLDKALRDVNSSSSFISPMSQRSADTITLRRVVLVEDIDAYTIQTLGSRLNIDPLFFAHYMLTELEDIEFAQPPPAIGSLPSTFVDKTSIHLHYQQILDLGQADPGLVKTYKFQSLGNIKRSARCTPSISGVQPTILRGCCSAILKHFDNGWICLIIMDPLTDLVSKYDSRSSEVPKQEPRTHIPFQGGFEDFEAPMPFSLFAASSPKLLPIKNSFLLNVLRYYEQPPPGLDINDPSLISLLYYPIRWVSSNWMLYVLLVNCYYKSYEYSVNRRGVETVLETSLVDLQRWRRRTKQSLSKLNIITSSIRLNMPTPQQHARTNSPSDVITSELSAVCTILLGDYAHLIDEIRDYRHGMDFLISISTTMFQLSTARQSIQEAINIRRLTYVAIFSAPLGLVAAVFSMSADFQPGQRNFWVFVVTALVATSFVVGLTLIPGSVAGKLSRLWSGLWISVISARQRVAKKEGGCYRRS